jgi:ureidoglycolate hydrolase
MDHTRDVQQASAAPAGTLAVPLAPLTAAAFAEYGSIVPAPLAATGDRATAVAAWQALARDQFGEDAQINHILATRAAGAPIETLEIHHRSPQLTVLLDRDWVLIVMAPGWSPAEPPTPATTRGFLVPKGQGVLLRAGLWHSGIVSIGGSSEALALFRAGTVPDGTTVAPLLRPLAPRLP